MDKLREAETAPNKADLIVLSRLLNASPSLGDGQLWRINEWLKGLLAKAPPPLLCRADEDPVEFQRLVDEAGKRSDADLIAELRAELETARGERDRLIGAIAEHVTVRGEYYARLQAAEARALAVEGVLRMCQQVAASLPDDGGIGELAREALSHQKAQELDSPGPQVKAAFAMASRTLPAEDQQPAPGRVFNENLGVWLEASPTQPEAETQSGAEPQVKASEQGRGT